MVFYYIILGCLAVVLQMTLFNPSSLTAWRPELPALTVVLAAIHMRDERVYVSTGVTVVFHSVFSAQPIAISLISYGFLAWFVLFQMQVFEKNLFWAAFMLALMGTFVFMIVDYLGYCFISQYWRWDFGLWNKILIPSLLNGIIAPLICGITLLIFSMLPERQRKET